MYTCLLDRSNVINLVHNMIIGMWSSKEMSLKYTSMMLHSDVIG